MSYPIIVYKKRGLTFAAWAREPDVFFRGPSIKKRLKATGDIEFALFGDRRKSGHEIRKKKRDVVFDRKVTTMPWVTNCHLKPNFYEDR